MKTLTKKEKTALAEFRSRIDKLLGAKVSKILLYGSKARGDAKNSSDTDVLVVLKSQDFKDKLAVFDLAFDIMMDFGIDLSTAVISQSRWNKYQKTPTSFSYSVKRDAIEIK